MRLLERIPRALARLARIRSELSLVAGAPPRELARELVGALGAVLAAERARALPARAALTTMRSLGKERQERSPVERARLRRVVRWADALIPPGPNCYRRVLAESALDRGAAMDLVVLGLDVGRTGHAFFRSDPEPPPSRYDVEFEV